MLNLDQTALKNPCVTVIIATTAAEVNSIKSTNLLQSEKNVKVYQSFIVRIKMKGKSSKKEKHIFKKNAQKKRNLILREKA